MPRQPKCSMCGAVIEVPLVQVSPANDWLCLKCSGAMPEDFMDEEEYARDRVEMERSFHGKSQWD